MNRITSTWKGILTACTVALLGGFFVIFPPGRFEAKALFHFDTSKLWESGAGYLDNRICFAVHGWLKGPFYLEQVIKRPAVSLHLPSQYEQAAQINHLSKEIKIEPLGSWDDGIIVISYKNSDPNKAFAIVNGFVDLLAEQANRSIALVYRC